LVSFFLAALLVGWGSSLSLAQATNTAQVASLAPSQLHLGFDYDKSVIQPNSYIDREHETKKYIVQSLSFPSIGDNGQQGNLVTALYYQSKRPGKKKLIVVLPIWGTHTYPSRKITNSLMDYSDGEMNILRILGKDHLFDWDTMSAISSEQELIAVSRQMVERVRTHVKDIRRAVDWAESQPDVDPGRIGLVGFSLGATVASLVVENEPRIGAGVLAMGGANINEMFATCFGRAEETREVITKRLGWTRETFERKLAQPLAPINPASFAGQANPDRIIMFDARYDTCMPRTSREALWQALGQPQRITWPYNHKMAFLTMTFLGGNTMRRKIYQFLDETL
jgi:dienelactone hydrolase